MSRAWRCLMAVLIGLVAALLGGSPAMAAGNSPTVAPPSAYSHDAVAVSTTICDTATERGPPASYDRHTAQEPVGRSSRGVSARPGGSAPLSTTTYTRTAMFVQVACAMTTTGSQVAVTDVGFSSLQRWHVAANGVGKSCRTNSFTGDTLVLMGDGSKKPIREVELGDSVMATDPITGERGPRTIVDLIRHGGLHTMVAVRLSDGTRIDATDQHPFWVASRGDGGEWVDAIDLESDDRVQTADGDLLRVASVRINIEDVRAFNLTVDDLHTYFVSDQEILVHNCGVDPLDERGLGHAVGRHTVGGDLVGMKPGGIFDSGLGESELAGLANATAGRVGRYRADEDVVEYIIGAGRPIGVDINGSTVSHYTVWRSSSGTLQTLFPGSVVR